MWKGQILWLYIFLCFAVNCMCSVTLIINKELHFVTSQYSVQIGPIPLEIKHIHIVSVWNMHYLTEFGICNRSSFSKLSVISPMSQLILQTFRHFTYATAHSPTFPSLYLRHSSFSNPSFASLRSQDLHLRHLASRPRLNHYFYFFCLNGRDLEVGGPW